MVACLNGNTEVAAITQGKIMYDPLSRVGLGLRNQLILRIPNEGLGLGEELGATTDHI